MFRTNCAALIDLTAEVAVSEGRKSMGGGGGSWFFKTSAKMSLNLTSVPSSVHM